MFWSKFMARASATLSIYLMVCNSPDSESQRATPKCINEAFILTVGVGGWGCVYVCVGYPLKYL